MMVGLAVVVAACCCLAGVRGQGSLTGLTDWQGGSEDFTQPPSINVQAPKVFIYRQKESVELPCVASGSPQPSYSWYKDKEYLEIGNLPRYTLQPNIGTLVITDPEDKDQGYYQCNATNAFGTSLSVKTRLWKGVLEQFPPVTVPTVHRPIVGASLKLTCSPPTSNPDAEIYWNVNKIPLKLDGRVSIDYDGNLYFANILPEDQQNGNIYRCVAYNSRLSATVEGEDAVIYPQGSMQSIVRTRPHSLYATPYEVSALRGGRIAIKCIFGGYPTPRIIWRRTDGRPLSPRHRLVSDGQEIWIQPATFEDEGTYSCEATNSESDVPVNSIFRVTVESTPYWINEPMDVNAAEEEDAEFFCRAEGIPAPRVSMFINGVPIENVNNPRLQVGQDKIIFKNLTKSDTLVVQCNATNKFQDGYVYGDAYLNVLAEEPSFLRPPPLIQEVPADKSTIIPCQVFGAPKPRISWTRNGVDVSGGAKYTIHPSGDLEIKNVQSSDGGEYACHASNKFGSGFRDGRLVVRAPTTLLTVPQDQMVELGSNVKFVCTARTDPEKMSKLEMYWLKDSERINLNQAQRLYENYMDNSLIISDVNLLDSGKYTCVAKNGLENDQSNHTATLVVQGRPEPPKVVTIMECGTQQARVSWSAGSDNYAQILKYRIEYNTTFTPATWVEIRTVSAANSQQYLPLSPYVNYTFRVLAQNRIGWSLPSTHSKQVCTTPPAAPSHNPENVETWNTEWDQLHIRWTPMAPVEHNGQGFHYLITYYRLDIPNDIIKSVRIDDWTQRELRIENTPFYTPYAIKVQAINSMSAAPDEPAIVGFSGESTPLVAPTNFMLNPNVAVTSNKASFIWDAVDPESDQIRGFMRGYQIQFWLEEEGEQGMRTEYIYTRDLALEGRNWVDKIRTKRQTPPKMEATISNLPSSQRIVAQVRVINKKYAGPPSNKIIIQTPEGVPGPVQNFQFVLVGPNHIKLQWNKPAEPNGQITGYDIGYRTVTGLSLGAIQYKEPAMTIGPDDTRDRFTATITGMKSSTRYRVYVWARTNVGRGEQDFLDAATLEPSSPGKPDFRAVAGPCSSVVDCPINVTFIPASVNPGGAFYVQYRKKGTNMWMNTFTETDRMWRNISKLDPGTTYEVRLVAMNSKQYSTASDVKGIDTLGSAMSIGYIGTAGWFYGMIIAILALILILIVVCVLRRKRGENYPVHEKEQLRGPEFEQHEGGFGEYQRGYDNAYYQRYPPPARNPEYDSDIKPEESDEDSMEEYADTDPSKFNEDGSFIGQYGKKPPPPNDHDDHGQSALSTFV